MKTDSQGRNWTLDAALFAGTVAAMWLKLTGIAVHEWLGLALIGLATYHLFAHRQWVSQVSRRLFSGLRGQPRRYFIFDGLLFGGFALIGVTGLAISTWLGLPLDNYAAWRSAHVIASVAALSIVVLKIGMHWRWIVSLAPGRILNAAPRAGKPAVALAPAGRPKMGRREFLTLMGTTGGSALLAIMAALAGDGSAQAAQVASAGLTSSDSNSAAGVTQASTTASTAVQSSSASTCSIRCNRRCSYPGHCRNYVDSNGNKLCDLGECLA